MRKVEHILHLTGALTRKTRCSERFRQKLLCNCLHSNTLSGGGGVSLLKHALKNSCHLTAAQLTLHFLSAPTKKIQIEISVPHQT